MKRSYTFYIVLLVAVSNAAQADGDEPETLYWDREQLLAVREGLRTEPVKEALKQLRIKSRASQKNGVYSVVDKQLLPGSGDRHDYASFGRYWWPNPDTADGLPYIRRDGVVNPAMLEAGDRVRLSRFCDDVEACALAGYLLQEEQASAHAAHLVRVWFLNRETRMRPRLEYAQAVPGRSEGRGAGILDARNFLRVLDSVACLRASNSWKQEDQAALVKWFEQYLQWLQESPIAEAERQAKNNHGVWFDAQEAGIACFVGKEDLSRSIVKSALRIRLEESFDDLGRQPHELERTRSLHYSLFSMQAWFVLARVGDRVSVDVWNAQTDRGVGLREALTYPVSYLNRQEDWPYPMQDTYLMSEGVSGMLLLAYGQWKDELFLQARQVASKKKEGRNFTALQFAAAVEKK